MLLLLQGKNGTELGGAAVPCNFDRRMQQAAIKFDALLKVNRTLTKLRTATNNFVKMCASSRTQTFGRTSN